MLGIDKEALQAQVREVQETRVYTAELTAKYSEAKKALEQTPEWQQVEEYKVLTQAQSAYQTRQEEALRSMALALYRETNDAKPVAGVTVKQYKHVVFDTLKAMEWCGVNLPALIIHTLSPEFVKVAENIPGVPIEVKYEPRVTVATDLSKAVQE